MTIDQLFDVRVGFWVNLHQRLYAESGLSARSSPITDPLRAPTRAEQEAWDGAVSFYKGRYPDRGLMTLFANKELMHANRRLSAMQTASSLAGADLPPELAAVLESVAPVYRSSAWPSDQSQAIAFRDRLAPLIARFGRSLSRSVPKAFEAEWPTDPIRLDIAAYAGPVGAYTVIDPAHITIASNDSRHAGDACLEILFHEASHALARRIQHSIERAGQARRKKVSPTLWHAVLFYSTGELVRRELGPAYIPYAEKNGLYERDPAWRAAAAAFARHWPEYLDGRATLDATMDRIVEALPDAGWRVVQGRQNPSRSPVSAHGDHLFRGMAITCFGASRSERSDVS